MTTTYFLNLIMGNVFRTATNPTIPTDVYIGLSSTEPALDGTGVTEPSPTAAYMRVILNSLSTPTNGIISNLNDIEFNESTSDWGTQRYFVIYDSLTGGNLLMYDALTAPRSIEAATIISIRTGDLQLELMNPPTP